MSDRNLAKVPPRVSSTPDSPKSLRAPLLPGNRRTVTSYRGPDDRPRTVDLAQLDRDLLQALADGPRGKWELQPILEMSEDVIGRQLRQLRARGLVKIIGRQLARRKWALVSYQAPAYVQGQVPQHPDALTAITSAKPTASRGSWWVGLGREQFQEACTRVAQTAVAASSSRTAGKGGGV